MPTHKERNLAAMRGETVDTLPYLPRIDLWYLANWVAGTLPEQHAGRTQEEIARAEGWSLYHRHVDDLRDPQVFQNYVHRGLGMFHLQDMVVEFRLPPDVEVVVERADPLTHVTYHTPLGTVSTTFEYSERMQRLGISIPHITDHIVGSPEDYPAAGYLFEHAEVVPRFDRFQEWAEEIGDDGVPVATGFHGGSPMQQIQRDLIDPTQFYFHYKDHERAIRGLAEQIEPLFQRILEISAESPADVVMWGANFDDMLTYPPYFEREIVPWIRKAADVLGARGKLVLCHTDGENFGLMDLIRDSGMHIAESICPYPMTRVTLEEYYRRWSGHLTLLGGIPSTALIPENTSEAEFEAMLDELLRAVAPGNRILVGIADQVPPQAEFSRLVRIGERIEREGRLPLQAGGFRPVSAPELEAHAQPAAAAAAAAAAFEQVRQDVIQGNNATIGEHVTELLAQGHEAPDILHHGLIAAMRVVGEHFSAGDMFIPEVLLSSRAMTAAAAVLEPLLADQENQANGKVLLGTVQGDMHNIGKNMVATMLKSMGFDVLDLGTNVSATAFAEMVAEYKPDILALSALLTTTMTGMGEVIGTLQERNLRQGVKVIVGGAPVSESFAESIGADGYAPDAIEAAELAKRLLEGAG